jgi:hypothetical protein
VLSEADGYGLLQISHVLLTLIALLNNVATTQRSRATFEDRSELSCQAVLEGQHTQLAMLLCDPSVYKQNCLFVPPRSVPFKLLVRFLSCYCLSLQPDAVLSSVTSRVCVICNCWPGWQTLARRRW